jgi:hypothetical protein
MLVCKKKKKKQDIEKEQRQRIHNLEMEVEELYGIVRDL